MDAFNSRYKREAARVRRFAQRLLGHPVRIFVTEGTVADCTMAAKLIDGISADYVLADKAYDTDDIVGLAYANDMEPCIPPKSNRKYKRLYDKEVYKLRRLVENAFLKLKKWRGIATRYAKNSKSFLATVHIRFMAIWAEERVILV